MKVTLADGKVVDLDDQGKVSLKVNGEWKEVPLSEVARMASEAGGAQSRFQQAAEREKEAEERVRKAQEEARTANRFLELGRKQEALTQLEFAEYQQLSGITDQNEISTNWAAYQARIAELTGVDPAGAAGASGGNTPGVQQLQQQISSLQQQLQQAQQQGQQVFQYATTQAMRDVQADVMRTLDTDPELAKLKPEQKRVLAEDMQVAVASRLRSTGGKYGPDALAAGLTTVKARAKDLGILTDPKVEAEQGVRQVAASFGLPESEAATVRNATQTGAPVKRVSVTDPNYEQNLTQRAVQTALQEVTTPAKE